MKRGVLYGAAAYLIWGFFPIYFKSLDDVPALQIMLHRVVWSCLFLLLVILIKRDWGNFRSIIKRPDVLRVYSISGVLLATNWLVYIYGVNSGQVVETSLGYFINPLLSVALGVIFLRERLRPLQWVPIGMAAVGVLYLTLQYGSLPWIALALAFSFGLYGLMKKIAPLGALHGLTMETGILFIPAVSYLLYAESQSSGAFGHLGWNNTLLLALSGIVTAIPLLLFASAAHAIPLVLIGILQYIAPTVQFLLGVFLYQEPFTPALLIGFIIIWSALLIFTLEGIMERRKRVSSAPLVSSDS
jgi:chloramphenicol-sensitive protein RarD